ncbi:cache domain-containing protein [Actinophytocola oryzae]|uniref:histidine kinase n=1 Tax=Actinophytocola oryzae TaxID=502181 RepID=A0A4V3FUU4_9PSEU|nr:cache domain-containing protein [Actinophytocola oryzae]TDV56581.1 HAMP domain-containing protein [Actinophytocola oryzae]
MVVRARRPRRPKPGHALTDQLPENGFPSGVSTPSITVLLLLLLHAGLCAVLLDGQEAGAVSPAVTESQQQLVQGAGSAIGASASQGIADLETVTDVPADTPDELLTRLLQTGNWRGAAVLDAATRALVATRGEPVSGQSVPKTVTSTIVTPVVGADGTLRVVVATPLPGAKLLVAARGSRLPDSTIGGDLREALLLTTSTGQVIDSRGTPPATADKDVNRLVELASAAGADGEYGSLTGRAVTGPKGRTEQPTVVYTPVSSSRVNGTLGLAVVSVVHAPVVPAGPGGNGVVPAVALVGVALFGFLLIRRVLVNPTRRLRADALAIAGGKLMTTRLRRARTREVDRIAAAFEHCRSELGGTPERLEKPRRKGMGTVVALGLTTGAVFAWSVGVLLTVGSGEVAVPDAVVASARNQTTAATEALRRSLNDGLADLTSFAALTGDDGTDVRSRLDGLFAGQSRYRGVYVIDQDGQVTASVGRPPLRAAEPLPAQPGILLRQGTAPVPVLFAYAPLPKGRTLVGEFDLDHIGRLLARAPGSVQLVDNGLRTIASTGGFIAFADLGAELRDSAIEAGKGDPVARTQEGTGSRAVVVSARLRGGVSGKLGWTVVAEQPVTDLALPDNELRRNAMVAALVAALLALLLFGWQYLLVIRPLRRVAEAADEIVAGRHGSVIYPQHQDQIGTIASCLEICRQAMTEGVRRLGGSRRPTGAATDSTELIAAVPATPSTAKPAPRRRRGQAPTRPRSHQSPSPARRGG